MRRREGVLTMSMLVFALGVVSAQDNPSPQSPAEPQSTQQPVPAYGQGTTPPSSSENPPLSGLDLPSLEPHAAPLSYLQPGATFSESVSTNIENSIGGSSTGSISRGLGNLALKRLWSNYDLSLDYLGGIAYYTRGPGLKQVQAFGVTQKILWKRGELSLRDSFSYLPEGNFGGAYGSLGSVGVTTMGHTPFGAFWGGNAFGAFGITPRIVNVAIADVTERLTPKSSFTAAGGYAFTHFYGDDTNSTTFIGSSQVSAQAGYNRILTPHTQVALVYGYQGFDFTVVGTAFHSHIIQGMVGHRITGRMDLLLGAGPQFTRIGIACNILDVLNGDPHCSLDQTGNAVGTIPTDRINVAAQARLRYKFTKSTMDLRYERFQTSGGGLFAGAQSDIIHLSVERPLSRVWSLSADVGYAHNDRIQPLTQEQIDACLGGSQSSQNACPANDAKTYNYGFVGAALHRHFGHNWHGFVSYQDNELSFDRSFCTTTAPCDRTSNRQVVTFGLDWTPRPIRID